MSTDAILGRLMRRLSECDEQQLRAVEAKLFHAESNASTKENTKAGASSRTPKNTKDWPRAPVHRLNGKGAFMVTGATYNKQHLWRDPDTLDYFESQLLAKAIEFDWQLEAWAIFSNHYHFVGQAHVDAESLVPMIQSLHSESAIWLNDLDDEYDRQVWYNYWDTELTYEKSYFARLHYVHRNAVHHGLVTVPNQYRWCSAAWFEQTATPAQVKTIYSFKTDKLSVYDDFLPSPLIR
ncbi:MAG: hypothetical protein AAF497_20385 [Planctomycetota bacterium]